MITSPDNVPTCTGDRAITTQDLDMQRQEPYECAVRTKHPQRYISIEGGTISLGAYVRAIKYAKAHPDAMFKSGLTCWWPCSGAEIVRQFRDGMNDRINQAVSYSERGF
jgi:hypothetical protein